MFRFALPVRGLMVLTGLIVALYVASEVLTTNQARVVIKEISQLKALQATSPATEGFRAWITGSRPEAARLRWALAGLAGLMISLCVTRYLRFLWEAKFSMQMVYYIREAVYDKLQRVGFRFHDRISTGQLINRALTDLQNVRTFVQSASLTALEIILIVGGYMALLLTRSVWVAVLSFLPLPFWVYYILRFGRRVQPASKAVMEAEDKNVSMITENIAGVHVIKAFATENQEIRRYNEHMDGYIDRVLARIKLFADFRPVIRGISAASHLSLFLLCAVLILSRTGRLDPGDFLMLGMAMGAILGRLQQVDAISDQYQNAIVSARRLHEVLAASPTVPEAADATPLAADTPGSVKFQNVTFGYDPAKPVLHDISFEIKGGSVVAIVGPTGSGKTTLVSLIGRFYDPQQGLITIDGQDVRQVRLDSLRTQIAYVFQETYLFSDSVEANVAYGRPHITGGEVEAASRLAQAHEFIEGLPREYRTILGERGTSLSGGQRQRLSIARAILSNPRILVLDDATASVDPETEDLIRRAMDFVMGERTTFLIAHRISSVKRADVVIVLEHGRIVQVGTHEQLMEREGHYRDIAVAQLYGAEAQEGPASPSHMKRMGRGGAPEPVLPLPAGAPVASREPAPPKTEEDAG